MAARNMKVHRNYPRPGCPHCGLTPRSQKIRDGENACPFCGKVFMATVFDPPPEFIFVKPAGALALNGAVADGAVQAPCAKHELNAAVGTCGRCGNFVCALCATPLGGTAYCTACFERLLLDGDEHVRPALEANYVQIAVMLSVGGLLPLGLLLGPLAIYYGVKALKQVRRCGLPFIYLLRACIAVFLGVLETAAYWGGLGFVVVTMIEKSK